MSMHISLEEKIAQMCLIGIDGKEQIEPVMQLIKNRAIGGVILYRKDYDTYRDMVNLVKALKECNKDNKFPLFIAIDQEGGRVNRMPDKLHNIYNAARLGAANNVKLIKQAGVYTGNMLDKTGINMDFAPVLDLQTANYSDAIGNRAFSKNADLVALYGLSYLKGLNNQNVIGVVKHFPGHGAVKTDSHKLLPVVKNYDIIKATHLYPFVKAIQNNVDAIMVGHILIKGKTGLYPCSLSNTFIKHELRKNLKYKGVVVSDELSMRSVRYLYGRKRSIKLAVLAGNDVLCYKYYPNIENDMIDNIANLVKKGKIPKNSIKESFKRIVLLKEKYELSNDTNYKGVSINLMNFKIDDLNKEIDKLLGVKEREPYRF